MKTTTKQISLNASAVARLLVAIALFLVLASIGGQLAKYVFGHGNIYGLVRLFYLDSEYNLPSYYSVLLMLCASLLSGAIAVMSRHKSGANCLQWTVLSIGFLLMSYDEAFQVHERLIAPLRTFLDSDSLGIFYFAWVIPGIALILSLGLFFRRFLIELPAKTSRRFVVAAFIYIAGLVGVELAGGQYAELQGTSNLTYSMIATIEESLEMAGLIVFVWALLAHYSEHYGEVHVRFDP